MATRRSKLLPELEQPTPVVRPKRVPLVHIDEVEGGWNLRVGRRVEATFATRYEAVQTGMPRARELSTRLVLHTQDGRVRELATSEEDEMFLALWRRTYAQHNPPKE